MPIHPTAIVDAGAKLAKSVTVGPYAIIEKDVTIAAHVTVGAHAVIQGNTKIGRKCTIHPHAVLGGAPQNPEHDGSATKLLIGEGNVFREFVTAHRGSSAGDGVTTIGKNNYFMANSHIAHDVTVGSGCVFANSAAVAGFSEVGDGAMLSGLCALHQKGRIGRLALVGGGAMCAQDVPPFTIAQGDRAKLFGLNVMGLRRAGLNTDAITNLKSAWRLLFTSGLSMRVAMNRTMDQFGSTAEVKELIEFVGSSQRGVCRAAFTGSNA